MSIDYVKDISRYSETFLNQIMQKPWVAKYIDGMPKDQTILVDWMPNLKFLISAPTFVIDYVKDISRYSETFLNQIMQKPVYCVN
jgi:predicted transcriptional regulator